MRSEAAPPFPLLPSPPTHLQVKLSVSEEGEVTPDLCFIRFKTAQISSIVRGLQQVRAPQVSKSSELTFWSFVANLCHCANSVVLSFGPGPSRGYLSDPIHPFLMPSCHRIRYKKMLYNSVWRFRFHVFEHDDRYG